MSTSFTELGLLVAVTALSLAVASWLARLPRGTGAGIAVGTLSGIGLTFAASSLVGFLGYLLPFGQIDFWLANLLAGLVG